MATVVWTLTDVDLWEGEVNGSAWFRVGLQPAFGKYYLQSALPLPLDSGSSFISSEAAKAQAQEAVDAILALVAPTP